MNALSSVAAVLDTVQPGNSHDNVNDMFLGQLLATRGDQLLNSGGCRADGLKTWVEIHGENSFVVLGNKCISLKFDRKRNIYYCSNIVT